MAGRVLYLVRHGESVGNVDGSALRRNDPPLTERGRGQAARAAEALVREGPGAVLTSPLRRARETAEVIGAVAGLEVRPVAGFHEVDMGALTDAATPADRALREAIFSAWLAGDRARPFPGGEAFADVVRRVREGLSAALAAAPSARGVAAPPGARGVVVVTHRMPIAAAAALCDPGGRAGAPSGCPNGSITTLEILEGEGWRLLAWSDARHLYNDFKY